MPNITGIYRLELARRIRPILGPVLLDILIDMVFSKYCHCHE